MVDSASTVAAPTDNQDLEHWSACHDCDLLLPIHDIMVNKVARCPRCRAVLFRHKKDTVNRTLAFSLSALLFYVPANVLPILTLDIYGNSGSNTMLRGVAELWLQGFWWMAFLVAICSIAMPLFELSLLLYISLTLRLQRYTKLLPLAIKLQRLTSSWAMLEVYLLGIIVAIIKMSDLGNLVYGQALICYVALLILTLCALQSFDRHAAWQMTERLRHRGNHRSL